MAERQQWQVKLTGEGEHRIQVELRVPVKRGPCARRFRSPSRKPPRPRSSWTFPSASPTSSSEQMKISGRRSWKTAKGTRLTAHLSPRSKLDVSWTSDADSGSQNPPLLTAQGEIEIDIDEKQLRTRSSWAIRCVRGTTRSLELGIDDEDEVTELQLDDQSMEAGRAGRAGRAS